jgi:hypothetical protein
MFNARVEPVTTKPFFWEAFILPEGRPLRLGRPEVGGRVLFNCAGRLKPARSAWCSSSMCSIAIDTATICLLPGDGA